MENIYSPKLDAISKEIDLQDTELKKIFQHCLKVICEEVFTPLPDGSVIVSGANKQLMTLRESTALLIPLCMMSGDDAALQVMIRGVIDKQLQMILADPYANSFLIQKQKIAQVNPVESELPSIFERHFTLDALLSPIQLIWSYWQTSQDDTIFDETTLDVFRSICNTLMIEQNHNESSEYQLESIQVDMSLPDALFTPDYIKK